MTKEYKLMKVNEFKFRGFEISLAKHPEDGGKLFVVAIKGDHVVRLFAEPSDVAIEYIRKIREQ